MKKFYILMTAFVLTGCGDGAFDRLTTFSGVAVIPVKDKPVTCFVEAQNGSISCLPNWFIEGKNQ